MMRFEEVPFSELEELNVDVVETDKVDVVQLDENETENKPNIE